MLKKIFYTVVIIIVIFITVGFFLPREVHVERSVNIDRPAATVFTLVNGYQTFNDWSPWAARDPSAEYRFSGPDHGVGASMSWVGDPRLTGSGSLEVIESQPNSLVRARLDFEQQGEAVSYFAISERPSENGVGRSTVTWGFDTDLTAGQSLFGGLMARYFGLLFDRWIGTDYELGLSRLKAVAESLPDVDFTGLEVEVMDVEPVDILFIESDSSQDSSDIAETLASSYQAILNFMGEHEIAMSAQPMAITRAWDESGYAFDAAIPVFMPDNLPTDPASPVKAGQSPAGRAVRVIHRGPYDQMKPTYEKLLAYMGAHGLEEGPVSWEQYISDPGQTADEQLITYIYFMIEPAQPD